MSWRATLAAVVVSATAACAAGTSPSLSDDETRRVDRGETVVLQRGAEGFAWPEIVTYRRTTASPAAIMAVYADFAAQSSWVPDLVESRVVTRESGNVFRVFYEYEVPGPNEKYTVLVTVTRDREGWQARWRLVSARYARYLRGSLRVIPRGDGSLVVYTSAVDPGTIGATFGSPKTVATKLVATTEALVARAERFTTADPQRLTSLVEALRAIVTPSP